MRTTQLLASALGAALVMPLPLHAQEADFSGSEGSDLAGDDCCGNDDLDDTNNGGSDNNDSNYDNWPDQFDGGGTKSSAPRGDSGSDMSGPGNQGENNSGP